MKRNAKERRKGVISPLLANLFLHYVLWSVWQKYHPKCTVSLRQAPESLGQGEVQAVEDADTGRAKDKPGKENESELVSPLERHLRDNEMLDRKSRMKREFHVRFCEGPKGRFLWPTRPHRQVRNTIGIKMKYNATLIRIPFVACEAGR